MVTSLIGISPSNAEAFPTEWTGGGRLGPQERKDLSLQALAGDEPICRLAERHKVSRKFVYQQAVKATEAPDAAFATPGNDDQVIFYLPVTKDWLRQVVLAEVLLCHSSFRGVRERFSAVFDLPVRSAKGRSTASSGRRSKRPASSTMPGTFPGFASGPTTRSSRRANRLWSGSM